MTEYVQLVDEHDVDLGVMEKLQAHQEGKLHRAISVFVFNSRNELLLQKRAVGKYHSGGLWTNTCCSHPRPQEAPEDAAIRRLQEEMGITCQLTSMFHFTYKAKLDNDLTEYELDHVFTGVSDELPNPDPSEAEAYRYVTIPTLLAEIDSKPENFTVWFKIILNQYIDHLKLNA